MKDFQEIIRGDEGEIGNFAEVLADSHFVHVITDTYEGHAMFDVSVARKLVEVLGRAILHVESLHQGSIGTP